MKTIAELDAMTTEAVLSLAEGNPEIADFPRRRYLGSLLGHLEGVGGTDIASVVRREDVEVYAGVRMHEVDLTDFPVILDFDRVERLPVDVLGRCVFRASLTDFPRKAYEDAYEGYLERLDAEALSSFSEAADLDDLSLYAQVEGCEMGPVEIDGPSPGV